MQNKEVAYSIYSLGNKFADGFIEQYKFIHGIIFSKVEIKLDSLDFGVFVNEDLKFKHKARYLLLLICNDFGLSFANEDASFTSINSGEIYPLYFNEQTEESYKQKNIFFPYGQYKGLNILIDIDKFTENIYSEKIKKEIFAAFFEIKFSSETFEKILLKLNTGFTKRNFMISSFNEENPFRYMHNLNKYDFALMADIKLIELFAYISNIKTFSYKKEKTYFYKDHIEKVKKAQYKLISNLDRHITIKELAQEFNISASTLKSCFKFVYGKPVDTYIREYKMYKACGLLKTTDYTIAFISELLGYESAGKFSAAFKRIIKISPSRYRRN